MSDIQLLPSVQAFLQRQHGCYIDGKALPSQSETLIEVVHPGDGRTVARIGQSSADEVQRAVASARRAFEGTWAKTAPLQKGALLNRLADLIEQHSEELAQLETLASGKTIQLSRHFEVAQSSHFLRYYAGWAGKINGETLSPSLPSFNGEQYTAFTRREPVGVVAGIVPWNFSLLIAIWKIASALICGCTIVLKPSEFTPLTLLRLAELATEAGIPDGVLNVVNGTGQVGQQLIENPLVAKVSFTGSVPTGIAVGSAAMRANLTRATLELGGKNAAAFLADVDTQVAANGIIEASFLHQGQVCASAERIYIHRSRIDEIIAAVGERLTQLKVGSPLDETTQFGPVANKAHFEKLLGCFAKARQENSQIVYGGKAIERQGYFIEPTLIRANGPQDSLLHEETFGPVATFLAYDDEEELIGLMNDSPFGLSASLWTNDLSKAMALIPRIEAGTVWVNMHTFLDPAVPFGGVKASGVGREFGSAFIDDYTELKSVMIRY